MVVHDVGVHEVVDEVVDDAPEWEWWPDARRFAAVGGGYPADRRERCHDLPADDLEGPRIE